MSGRVLTAVVLAATLAITAPIACLAPAVLGAPRAPDKERVVVTPAPVAPRGPTQVVVFDRQLGTTTVVSHDQTGVPGTASSSRPSISADGSFIAFQSDAGLVTTDTDDATDVYLWDRAIGGVQQVSRRPEGGGSNGESRNPSIAGDSSIVAFASTSTNITTDEGLGDTQVFSWDRLTGAVSLVSSGTEGGGASGGSGDPSVSSDGRVVAFESTADDLVDGDTNGVRDIFLRDLARGATIRASVGNDGRQVAAESRRPAVSGDGGAVIFDSIAGGLGPNDTNKARDVYLRDLPPAVTVSPNPLDFGVVPLGTPANGSVVVLSHGWTPVSMLPSSISGLNAGDFLVAGDACAFLVLPYGASCAIAIVDIPTAAGPRTATLEVNDTALDSPQRVALKGGVPGPELRLEPAVGPPGMVAILYATNLPPGALVTAAWDRGITPYMPEPFVAGPDGSVTIQMLIFHHDLIGPRQLVVTAAPGGPPFTVAPLPFLVVPPPLQPPGESAIRFLNPELQLIPSRR